MSCGGCEATIKAGLADMKGIRDVFVDVSAGKTTVVYDDQLLTDADQIARAITASGYPARIWKKLSREQLKAERVRAIEMSRDYVASVGERKISRYDYDDDNYKNGIPETFSLDNCKHSLFGVSKAAADLLTQEYGRYFGLKTGIFRGGCLTGTVHSAVELHGFLSYLVKCIVHRKSYTIFGYKGKQVRDQIHSKDVILALEAFRKNPKCGEVYNLGGGKENAASILECIIKVSELTGIEFNPAITEENRVGDHICYYSDLGKLKSHFSEWGITVSLDQIIKDIVEFEMDRR